MAADLANLVANLRIEAKIPPPARTRQVKDGFSSVYQFEMRPQSHGGAKVFRYDVELVEMGKNKSLTLGCGDDGKKGLLRTLCFELVNKVSTDTQGFGSGAAFVYDNRKNMYTNQPIATLTYEVPPDQMTAFTRAYLRDQVVKVEIKPCQTEAHELDLNDFASSLCPSPTEQADRSLRTFLEMMTSQPFINADTHDIIGAGRLFERRIVKQLEDGIVTRNGVAKGVRIIDNDGNPRPALVADVKTCAFFGNMKLDDIVRQMMQKRRIDNRASREQIERFWGDFNQLFRGVSGYLTYATSRVIVIDSVTQRTMSELSFDVDGRTMSMVDFFMQKKKIRVDGNMPAIRQQNDRETLFPMSCIMVLPNQRVPIDKMNDFISRELLNANTTAPDVRYKAIENEVRKIGTGASSEFMAKFGVKLVGGRNNVKIGIHDMPKVKFADMQATFADRIPPGVKYLEPSNVLKNWVVGFPRKVLSQDVQKFVDDILRMGRGKGMQIPNPKFEDIELDNLPERMQEMFKSGVQFLLYIDNKFVKSHSILKLNEKRYGLLTQHVTIEVAGKARAMTLCNVLNKMNMKLFGYNYMPMLPQAAQTKFNMQNGEVLVIGVDTSRPPRATAFEKFMLKKRGLEDLQSEEPQIVGICANYMPNPWKFCGDYYYQPCKQDVLEPNGLLYKIGWILDKVKTHRKKAPSVIMIIRDGVSEGMIPNNIRNEFPSYMKACKSFDANWNPKFVYCIVDKKHNKRFFLNGGQQNAENTTPGCVIDSKVTRVDLHEFWLQSHVPLKGTAKLPQYVFPINEIKADNNELQNFLLALCCNWQIVNLAPALPTPVRQAAELAKRGRNNYMEMKRNAPQFIPRDAGTNQIDYMTLNNRLCYNGHAFSNTRFNA